MLPVIQSMIVIGVAVTSPWCGRVVMGVPRGPKLGSLARSNTPSGILQKIHHPYLPVRPLKAMPLCLLEIGPMNVGRGLFRGWIFLTVLWLIGAGTLAYFIIRDEVSHWKWQYVHEARTNTLSGEVDWSRPYYEMMRFAFSRKPGCDVYGT